MTLIIILNHALQSLLYNYLPVINVLRLELLMVNLRKKPLGNKNSLKDIRILRMT